MHSSEDMAVWRLYGSRMHRVADIGQLSAPHKTGGVPKAMCATRRDVSLKLPVKLSKCVQYLKLDGFSSASCQVHEFNQCRCSFGLFQHLCTDAQKVWKALLLFSSL
jgi:hypothetical protein